MTSRAQRRGKKASKRRSQAVPVSPDIVPDLPRPIRLVLDSADLLYRYLKASRGDLVAAAWAALADTDAATRHIAELAKPYDAFDVLESVRLHQTPLNPESYRETEDEHSAAVIELCALVLAARGQRAGTLPDVDGHRARADSVIDEVLQECSTALALGSMVSLMQLTSQATTIASIQRGAVLREVFVRNLSYVHMVEDTLGDLFDEPSVAQACRDALGCTVGEIRSVFAVLVALHERAWQSRFDALDELGELAQSEMASAAAMNDAYVISPDAKERGLALWTQFWSDPAEASTFSSEVVASEAGLESGVVNRILDLFGYQVEARDPAGAARELFEGRSPLPTAPILREPEGSWVVVHSGLLVPAIRGRVEQELSLELNLRPTR